MKIEYFSNESSIPKIKIAIFKNKKVKKMHIKLNEKNAYSLWKYSKIA